MKIAVYGAGGVGAYFGGRLAQSGAEVHLIARGAHLAALRNHGLRLRSVLGDADVEVAATDDPAEVGACDYVLLAVKSYDTEDAAARLTPLVGEGGTVISLQNGVDNEEKVAARIGWEHVMGGVTYIFSTILEPGVVEHAGGPANIVFGEMDGSQSRRALAFLDACRRAGIDATLSTDIRGVLWRKLSAICAVAAMTSTAQLPVGAWRSVPESRTMFRRLIDEVRAVADAEGVALPEDLADQHLAWVDGLEPDVRSSLYHDLSHGHRMELDALHGAVVRRGQERGVAVPMSEAVYAILKPWALAAERDG